MEKFSVKKPFTVFVAVVIVLILGYVSLDGLKTDLLPELSLPYMIVVTPYPGAGPERVESQVAEPLEAALGTVSNVKNVFSVCADSYCITQLELRTASTWIPPWSRSPVPSTMLLRRFRRKPVRAASWSFPST